MKSKQQKREEAQERNEAWAELAPAQQLASLDKRNLAAKKQRARIQAKLAAQSVDH